MSTGGTLRLLTDFLLLSSLASPSLTGQGEKEDPFSECEVRLAAQPDSWAAICFVHAARSNHLGMAAKDRVEDHRTRRPGDPYLRYTLGVLEMDLGRLPQAGEHFHAAAATFSDRNDFQSATQAWLNRAQCQMRQGRLEEAAQTLRWAQEAARAAANPNLETTATLYQIELLRRRGGDLERMEQRLTHLQDELADDAPYPVWKVLLHERAALLSRLGRYPEARRLHERHAELARLAGKHHDEATALSNVAINAVAQPPHTGVREEAIQLARVALELAERTGNRPAAVTAHRLLGKLLPGAEGRAHLESCLRQTSSTSDANQRAACLFALAGSLAAEDGEQARRILGEALDLVSASEDPWPAAYGWAQRFRVNWATLPRQQAAADSLAFLDHIETLRRLQSSETGRAAFFTDWVDVYYSLVGFLLRNPDGPNREELATAFTVAERLRARVLLDSLAAARVETPPGDGPRAEEGTAVLREIVRVQRRLLDPALVETERRTLVEALEDLEHALAALAEPSPANALSEQDFAELAQVEASLAPDQALLAFLVAPDEDIYGKFAGGSWLLAVTNGGSRTYRLPGRMELENRVEMFVSLVKGDGEEAGLWDQGAVTLYEDLFGPALADLPGTVEYLILIPDGVLHLLPFGLLRPHPQAEPLVMRYRLASAPSATLWHHWRQALSPTVASATAALALADPAFVGAAPAESPAGSGVGTLEAEDRSWTLETGQFLGRLPFAETEGRALVRRLGGPPNRVLIGEEASEAFLKGAPLDAFGVLHFAAHALVDEERPRRSAVLLAAGDGEEDGLLQPREIAALNLADKLVVVSACDSGSGQVLLGEGVQSLARAFFRAGARAVVASLWRLEDDEAAAFFDLFYRALARGDSVAGAVATAQRQLRADGAPATAWAGVVVLGDGDLVPLPGGIPPSGRGPRLLLAGLLLLALLGWLVRRWRVGVRAG